jgi:hypothetical protein
MMYGLLPSVLVGKPQPLALPILKGTTEGLGIHIYIYCTAEKHIFILYIYVYYTCIYNYIYIIKYIYN